MPPKSSDPKPTTDTKTQTPAPAADDANQAAAPAADATAEAASAPAAEPTGTKESPSKAASASALKKLGIEIIAEAKHAEDLICRVLSDGKRVWKEFFHEA